MNPRRWGTCVISCVVVFAIAASPAMGSVQRDTDHAWAIGVRAEYVTVGGDQFFQGITDGPGVSGFLSRRVGQKLQWEFGISTSVHKAPRLIYLGNTDSLGTSLLVTAYTRPTILMSPRGGALVPYLGGQVGFVAGEFTDAGLALQLGASSGVIIRLTGRLDADLGVTASGLYDPSAGHGPSRWGRTLALRSGMIISVGRQ